MRSTFTLFLSAFVLSRALTATISNVVPRRDTDGDIVEAGDGCISFSDGVYYLFGARYQPCAEPDGQCYCGSGGCGDCEAAKEVAPGECCGWRNMTYAVWSSTDLMAWTKEGLNILPVMTDPSSPYNSARNAYFEPCGIFNRRTGFWVLWFAHPFSKGTAVSRLPAGPYDLVQWDAGPSSTDFYLWLDVATDAALMKHNGDGGEFVAVLSDDYLSIANTSAIFGADKGFTEGGGIFQLNSRTYVMAGYGCCFCPLGSNGFLWSAETPLGNYSFMGDHVPRYANGSSVTQAQQFSVTPVYTAGGVVPMFIGVRFGSAPDRVKNHDFQFWAPLSFDAAGAMANVSWVDEFTLQLGPPPPSPTLPPPPPAWYLCPPAPSTATAAAGVCIQVPVGYTGSFPTAAACAASCVLCQLGGEWYGGGNRVVITQSPISNVSAAVSITAPGFWKDANGTVGLGSLQVTGGWCGGATCKGVIAAWSPGGPPCSKITWEAGTWCSPAADPTCPK